MDPTPRSTRLAAVVAALEGRHGTRWVGVDGKGASGKTTLRPGSRPRCPGR